ncbi:hypothetical protein OC834_006567 [Tilletia horrida]|nr:hypothetical protein OC834_006567 [Tilletia horrida]KAK0529394.1 hypothetical protein OC835_004347 [Tilletia horrida]KAK0545319.1 hypothetical protein OC844_007370 [Tilletia horrida]
MPNIDLADPAFRNAATAQWAAVQGGPNGGLIVHGNYNQPGRSGPDKAFMTIFKKFNDLQVEHKHLQEEFNLLKKRYDTSKGRLKKLQTGETRASNKASLFSFASPSQLNNANHRPRRTGPPSCCRPAAAQSEAVSGGPAEALIVHGNHNAPARSGPDDAYHNLFKKLQELEKVHKLALEELELSSKRLSSTKGRMKKLQTGEARASSKLAKEGDEMEKEHEEQLLKVNQKLIDCMEQLKIYRIRANPEKDP